MAVTQVNPETNPEQFYLKDEKTGEYDKLYEKTETDDGISIKSKSATEAGYQSLTIEGDTTKLYDGDKLVAKGQIRLEVKGEEGEWKGIEDVIASPSSPVILDSTVIPDRPAAGSGIQSLDSQSGSQPVENDNIPEIPITPLSFIWNLFQHAKAQEVPVSSPVILESNGNSTSGIQDTVIKTEEPDKLEAQGRVEFATGDVVSTNVEIKAEGEGKDTAISQKQTFKTGASDQLQRLVWEIKLKDFDVTEDSSSVILESSAPGETTSGIQDLDSQSGSQPVENDNNKDVILESSAPGETTSGIQDRSKSYGSTIIDVSDYNGDVRWVESAKDDTVTIYFDEEGTTEDIVIDPILAVTEPANQITVDDGTHKWIFDTSVAGAPKYYYDDRIGSGADNLASINGGNPFIGPGFAYAGASGSITQTIIENTPTRVKIRAQGAYATTPTAIDNYYTIYPDGRAFIQYSETIGGSSYARVAQHYLSADPQVQDHDNTNHAFVQSDTSNNNYPGMAVVPFTSAEYGDAASWSAYNNAGTDRTLIQKTPAAGTYSGNMVIDFSNYRATTTTRDALLAEYRTPATLANFDAGSQTGDGFNEAEGAYTITADASGDAQFDVTVGASTRIKPVFYITDADRAEDAYQVFIGATHLTKGIDYNLSKIDATTATLQLLASYAADITDLQISDGSVTGTVNKIWDGGGADNDWSTQENWSDDTVPGASDNVTFGGTSTDPCTVDADSTPTIASLTIAPGYTGTITVAKDMTISGDFSLEGGTFNAATFTINIGGNYSRVGGTFTAGTSNINMNATAAGKTFTAGGQTYANITFNGVGGGWTLQDALTISSTKILTLTNGTLNTNNQTMSIGGFYAPSAAVGGVRTLTLGSSQITMTGGGGSFYAWQFDNSTNLTFNANTSTLTFTASGVSVYLMDKVFNNVVINGGTSIYFTGSGYTPTFSNFTIIAGDSKTASYHMGQPINVTGTLTLTGFSSTSRLFVDSRYFGISGLLTATNVSFANVDFRDITFGGSPTISPAATSIGDCGGNSSTTASIWTNQIKTAADTETWDGSTADGKWSTADNWTGGSVNRVPLPQDTVVLTGASVVTADMPRLGKDISFTTDQATPLTLSVDVTSYGSLNFTYAGTFTQALKSWTFESQARSGAAHTLTSAGKSFAYNVSVNVYGATLVLADNFTLTTYTLAVNYGTLDAATNNVNVTSGYFVSNNSKTRGIKMGTGLWNMTNSNAGGAPWNVDSTALTFEAGQSTVQLSASAGGCNFVGGGVTYNNVNVLSGTGVLTVMYSSTFANLTIGAGKTVKFTHGTTQTITGTFTANGTSSSLITLQSDTTAIATINHTNPIISQWNTISYITSGSSWTAHYSSDPVGSTNTNITFPAYKTITNGGGNWGDVTTWSDGTVPLATDEIAATPTSGNVTINAAAVCKSADFTGYVGTLTHTGVNIWTISGDLKFSAGMTFTNTTTNAQVVINATSNITTNGKAFAYLSLSGSITANLQDDLNISGYFAASGTPAFVHNNHKVIMTNTLNTGIINVASNLQFYDLEINGKNTTTTNMALSSNIVVTHSLVIAGSNGTTNRLILQSNILGTQRTINADTATVTISNTDFRDINFNSAIDLRAVTGGSGDCGGNANITFTPAVDQHWKVASGGNWSNSANWTSRVPLPQDNVYFNTAFSAGQTVTSDMPRLGKSIDWTGATGNPTWTSSVSYTSYGSLTLISGMTISASNTHTFEGRGSYTWTSAGKTYTHSTVIAMVGGTMTLQDDLNISGSLLSPQYGTFNANNKNVGLVYFNNATNTTRTITMGSGTWTISGTGVGSPWNTIATGLTLNTNTSTIVLSATDVGAKTFVGGGLTYNNLSITGGGTGAWTFTGANTFNDVTIGAPKTVTFPSTVTTTINGTFTANGTSANLITINSSSAGSAATIAHAGNIGSSWNSIQDITSTGGTWNASFSTSVSGNTGITFPVSKRVSDAGGNWDAGTAWDGGVAPAATDDIYADASSGNLTINVAAHCLSFDFSTYTHQLVMSSALYVDSPASATVSVRLGAGMTSQGNYGLRLNANSTAGVIDFYTNGHSTSFPIKVNETTAGTVNLRDAIAIPSTETFTVTQGTFNTNNFAMSIGLFSSSNSNTRTINLGSSNITVTGTGIAWNNLTATGLTVTANTSTITFTGADVSVYPGGKTYYNMVMQGGGSMVMSTGSLTNLTIIGTGVKTDNLIMSATKTITGTYTINGNSAINRLLVRSDSLGTAKIITIAAVNFSNVDFRDITFAGTMTVNSATSIGDCGGNSGVNWASIVTAPAPQTWTNVNGGNWSLNTNWTSRVPLPQDDVSLGIAFGTSKTVHADMLRLGKTIDWSGATYTTALTFTLDNAVTNYGGLNLTGISAFTGVTTSWTFESMARSGTQYIASAGKSFPSTVYIRVVNATLQLADAYNSPAGSLCISNGTFIDAGFSLTAYAINSDSGGTATRAITKTGNWTFVVTTSYPVYLTAAGLTWSDTAGSITISDTGNNTKTFVGGGLTYNNLNITGGGTGAVIFTGANTFNNFTIGAPKTVTFPSTVTTTINGTFTANGIAQPTKIIDGDTRNGNFETAGTGGFGSWIETVNGTSTVNVETTDVHAGAQAVRLDIDSSDAAAYVQQTSATVVGKRYKVTYWAKSSAVPAVVFVGNNTARVTQALTTEWTQYTSYFTATLTGFMVSRHTAANKSIYIDDVTLEESNDVEINSSSDGSAATLSKASGIVVADYAGVKDMTVTGGAAWYMGLNSTNISGNTGWLVDAAAPTDPTVTTATVDATPITTGTWINQAGTISFNYSGASDPDSGILGYYTYFGTNAAADPSVFQAQVVDPQAYSTPITTADDGKHFYFRVKTKDAVGNVGVAVTLFDFGYDITLPTRPTFIAADPPGYTTVNSYDFSWPAGTDPVGPGGDTSGIKWYEYKRAVDVAWSHTADAATRTVAGLTAYQEGANAFYVRTIDNALNTSSNYQQVTYYFSGVAPAKPTNIVITPDPSATNDLTITWDKSATGVGDPPVVGYYYSINAAPTINNVTYVASAAANVSIGPDHFATLQGENTIYILGVNAAGNYSFEDAYVASKTFTCQTPAPPAPVEVTISDSSNRAYDTYSLTIVWSAGVGQDPATFDHYAIERSTDGVTFTPLATTGNSTAYIDVSGLLNTTTYYYQIKSVDNAGSESAASTIVSKQPVGNYQTPPTILSNPTVGSITSQSATIAWTTDRNTSSIVRYGLVDGTWTGSSGQYDSVTDHSVILTGLASASRYYYQVQSLDEFYDYDPLTAYSSTYNLTTTAAPAISAVAISNITLTSADISFETTTVSTVSVNYGLTNTYGTSIEDLSGAGTTKHTVKLTGLETGTTYYFQITGLDDQGFPLNSDGYQFDTLALPRIENLSIKAIIDRPAPAFKAIWSTNVMTTTILRYRTLGGSEWKEIVDDESKLEHEVEVTDLTESTTYEVVAAGRDSIGNLAESPVTQFMTPQDSRPPLITDIVIETFMVRSGTNLKAQISVGWKTDEPASGQIDYGVGFAGAYVQSTTEETGLATQRSVIISDLKPATMYHLKIIAKDKAGNLTESEPQIFVTSEGKKSAWDLIRDVLMNVFGFLLKKYE